MTLTLSCAPPLSPVIAILGRANVGKSTLFNRLTNRRDALAWDMPGVTRDRQYGQGNLNGWPFIVIDTGGIGEASGGLNDLMMSQVEHAISEANIIYMMVDAKSGLTAGEEDIVQKLRVQGKNVILVVNKIDGVDENSAVSDFYKLGVEKVFPIAAVHGRGVKTLLQNTFPHCENAPPVTLDETEAKNSGIKIAIVGRPNVGKSTLVNRLLGENRVVVFDEPGTTRDSIYIPLLRDAEHYILIDTAGVRRKSRVTEPVEKFSVIKTFQAIQDANVVILVFDAREGLNDQELTLLSFIIEAGRGVIIAANKWDGMRLEAKDAVKKDLIYRLRFAKWAKVHFISALYGSGVGDLFPAIQAVYRSATQVLTSSNLTKYLQNFVEKHTPPLSQGRRIKLRYAHCGGHNPPIIVIHGNQTEALSDTYKRYLAKSFSKVLGLEGTPLQIICKTSDNPYKGKINRLTPRQMKKRQRLMKHAKKSKK